MKILHNTIRPAMSAVMALAFFVGIATALTTTAEAGGRNNPGNPVIYVTGQGSAYDSIALTNLPTKGSFQKLEVGGPTGLQTEFGPGERGYVGGRWWLDANGNGEMDEDDAFFMCPLLGPGYVPEG